MAQLFRNNAFSNLGAPLTNVATTLTVTSGHGDRFPVVAAPDFMLLTLQDASNNIEIVKVTARTAGSDSMTIIRAQEGTTARAWNIGDVVELRLTASALNPLSLLEGASTAAAIRSALGATSVGNSLFTAADASAARGAIGATTVGAAVLTAADAAAARTAIGAGTGNGDVTQGGTQTLTNKTLTAPVITENIQVISGNTTAVRSGTYILTASLTLTLPASPAAGDWVSIVNRSGTTTAVIGRNGTNIMGLAEDMTLDNLNASLTLTYADATRGWVWN